MPQTTVPELPTIGVIARMYGAAIHRIEHILNTRDIKPIGRAGNAYIYSDSDVEYIGSVLRRIERDKKGGDFNV